jgi:hypothetical protein
MKKEKDAIDWETILFQTTKIMIIAHLRNISNQEVTVPIPGVDKDVSVKDLIEEVEKETETGIKYMAQWARTELAIQEARRKKR